jgi:hypothetical protein
VRTNTERIVQLCAAAGRRAGIGQHLVWAAHANEPARRLPDPPAPRLGDRRPDKGQRDHEAQCVDCVRIVHFLRNALDHLPRKADDDCLQELRWLYDRRSVEEARRDLVAWIAKWGSRYPRLVAWVEETIEETLTFYRLPRQHHKHLKSTNML